jgi:microcystin degradation protein MlrC
VLVGYAWADEPRVSASVLAYGARPENTTDAAGSLAGLFWGARGKFDFGTFAGSFDECIERAREARHGLRIVSDSGDNPTAGGAGDVPFALERMLALKVEEAVYASIADPAAVAHCFRAGVGSEVEVSLGGKLDAVNAAPLKVRGTVVSAVESARSYGVIRDANRTAVLRIDGVLVIVTEKRTPFHHVEDFLKVGIDLNRHEILVVKLGYLVPELKAAASESYLALTPGAVNQNIGALPFRRIRRPLYPLDPDMVWDHSRNVVTLQGGRGVIS